MTASPPAHWARKPFYFHSAAHLLRVGRQKATNLSELLQALQECPNESIFQHMFQTLHEHHFLREGFSNDFAQWAFSACNEIGLAERLAAIDVREYTSIPDLRQRLVEIVAKYLAENERAGERSALEPFYFCASDMVVLPTPFVARNLEEFIGDLEKVSIHSIHFHFIEARLRLKLNSNDFSMWLEEELDLASVAARLNRIDIYTATLEDVRRSVVRILQEAMEGAATRHESRVA